MANSPPRPNHAQPEQAKSAVKGASFAFFVDAFDAYVPLLALAPAQVYFVPDHLSSSTKATIGFVVFFALSWTGRPIGAFIFGHFADTIGRRRVTLISIAGFGTATLLMGALPGFASLGLTAVVLFAILRLIGGIFIGGEYTGAAPLAVEYAPKEKRGLWGSLCNIGYPSALAANTLLVFALLHFIPSGGPDSPYSVWGWRIPFAIGVILAVWVFLYYYRSVPESDVWLGVTKTKAPIRLLFTRRQYVTRFVQVSVLMLGAWLTLNAVAGSLPTFLRVILDIDAAYATLIYLVSTIIGALLFPLIGTLGQNIGRRQLYAIIGAVNLLITPGLYVWMIAGAHENAVLLLLIVLLLQIPTLSVWALVTAYLTECFPTAIRSTAYGLAFSLTTIPAAFYAFLMLGLGTFMPYNYTVAIVLALGGALLLTGALLGPDNRHVEFRIGADALGLDESGQPESVEADRFLAAPSDE